MIISAIVIVLYTTLGGFLAASMTDLIQSIIMTIALFIVVIFGIHTAGGFDAIIANAKSMNGYLSLFSSYDPSRRIRSIQKSYHCINTCMGTRIFWHAAYPASFYGNRG